MSTLPRLRVLGGVSARKGKKLHHPILLVIQWRCGSIRHSPPLQYLSTSVPPPAHLFTCCCWSWMIDDRDQGIDKRGNETLKLAWMGDAKQKAPRDAKRSRDWITRRLTVLVHKYAIIQSILAPVRCCRLASPVCRDCWSPWLKCTKL